MKGMRALGEILVCNKTIILSWEVTRGGRKRKYVRYFYLILTFSKNIGILKYLKIGLYSSSVFTENKTIELGESFLLLVLTQTKPF